jgi:predicted phage replisome organizer
MSGLKWIKISTNMFDDEKIRLIEQLPEGDSILIIWIKLLALAGQKNAGGEIFVNDEMPYTDEMLGTIFHRKVGTVRLALKTFQKFRMVEILEDQTIVISNWSKHQNLDGIDRIREQNREKQRRFRLKQREQAMQVRRDLQTRRNLPVLPQINTAEQPACNATCNVTERDGVTSDSDTSPEQNKKENKKREEIPPTVPQGTVENDFNAMKEWLNKLFGRKRSWSCDEDQLLSSLLPISREDRALLSWAYALPRDSEGWALIDDERTSKPKQSLVTLLRDFPSELDKWRPFRRNANDRDESAKIKDAKIPPEWVAVAKQLYGPDAPLPPLKKHLAPARQGDRYRMDAGAQSGGRSRVSRHGLAGTVLLAAKGYLREN